MGNMDERKYQTWLKQHDARTELPRRDPWWMFKVFHRGKGRYQACVNLDPSGYDLKKRYCRMEPSKDKAQAALLCAQKELVRRAGPVVPVLQAWKQGLLCNEENPTGSLGCWRRR